MNESNTENPGGGKYSNVLENTYQSGDLPYLPEIEVFGTGSVDMEAVENFMYELVGFILKKEAEAEVEQVELDDLLRFAKNIHSEFLSASPNLVNYIRLSECLKLMTRATRSEVIQRTFGSVFVHETAYNISLMEGRLDEIVLETLGSLSISEQLDLLHQLRTIGAQAAASGFGSAFEQVQQTYETVRSSSSTQVFIQLAAEAGLEIISDEYENPQLGFMRREGQTTDSRINARFSNEAIEDVTKKFLSSCSLNQVVSNTTKFVPAANDALICLDRSGLAFGVVKIDLDFFRSLTGKELNFDVNQYRIYEHLLHSAQGENSTTIVNVFRSIRSEHMRELTLESVEQTAKIFENVFSILSKEEWKKYLIGEIKLWELPSEIDFHSEARKENHKANQEFIRYFMECKDQIGTAYQNDYSELEVALEKKDDDLAFEVASRIALHCKCQEQPQAIHQEIARSWDALFMTHRANDRAAYEKYRTVTEQFMQRPEIQAREEVMKKLALNLDELGENLLKFVQDKLSLTKGLPQLELIAVKDFITEIGDNKNFDGVTAEAVLLFQHVHSGELMQKIEDEFCFTFSDLSLREQFYFINFLKDITPSDKEIIKSFTQAYGTIGMKTFLALEQLGPNFGWTIAGSAVAAAEAGQQETAETVFQHFVDMNSLSHDAEEYLSSNFGVTETGAVETAMQSLRQRSANLLQQLLAESIATPDAKERVAAVAAQANQSSALFTSTFRVLQQNGLLNVEKIDDTSFETERAVDISPGDKERMWQIFEQRYGQEKPEFYKVVHGSFSNALENEHTKFYLIRHRGEIVGFNRFDDYSANDRPFVYFGSFLVDETFGGGKVGEVILEQSLQNEIAAGIVIQADCNPEDPISVKYIEKGFVATQFYEFGGKPSFHIAHFGSDNKEFFGKKLTSEKLQAFIQEPDETSVPDGVIIREQHTEEKYPELSERMFLTASFEYMVPDGTGRDVKKRFLVFEEPHPNIRARITSAEDAT